MLSPTSTAGWESALIPGSVFVGLDGATLHHSELGCGVCRSRMMIVIDVISLQQPSTHGDWGRRPPSLKRVNYRRRESNPCYRCLSGYELHVYVRKLTICTVRSAGNLTQSRVQKPGAGEPGYHRHQSVSKHLIPSIKPSHLSVKYIVCRKRQRTSANSPQEHPQMK